MVRCLILLSVFLVVSCVPTPVRQVKYGPVLHEFDITVVDENYKPLSGATIEYVYTDDEEPERGTSGTITTDAKGIFNIKFPSNKWSDDGYHRAKLVYKIRKDGFLAHEGQVMVKSNRTRAQIRRVILVNNTPAYHVYSFSVVGTGGDPISDATIDYVAYDFSDGSEEINGTETTDAYGKATVLVISKPINSPINGKAHHTGIRYTVKKPLCYSKNAQDLEIVSSVMTSGEQKESVTIICVADYLDPAFLSSKEGQSFLHSAAPFIEAVKLEGLLAKSKLQFHSIKPTKFKGKRWLEFGFDELLTYNSIKFNKYDVAINVYDETVRKLMTPLDNYFSSLRGVSGYKISMNSQMQNFADKGSEEKQLNYTFYLTKKSVGEYKNMDITGQQLIDRSIIVYNGERIGLKLQ